MPELPEVETIRAQLEPRLVGRLLVRVEILDPRLTRPIDLFEVAEELEGDSIMAVERRGKYLVLRLESGLSLLVHLRMTGSFGFEPTSHERAVLELDDGTRVGYRDVRRFGTWLVLEDAELEPYLAGKNGPEPLGARFTSEWLGARLAVRRAPVKSVLLDQRVVAGLGNIYADEALWRARVNPLRPAASLDRGSRCGACTARSGLRSALGSSGRDRPCPSTALRRARVAGCRRSFGSMGETACPAGAAARPSPRRGPAGAAPGTALAASPWVSRARHPAARRRSGASTRPT